MASVTGTARAFFVAAAGAAAVLAAPASAATFALPIGPGSGSTDFGNTSTTGGSISDFFTFTVGSGTTNSIITSIAARNRDVTLTSVTLNDANGVVTTFDRTSQGTKDEWTLNPYQLAAGSYDIHVVGTWGRQGGSYAGTLNFDAVPEPATWGLMILGFGAIGGAMRRRQSVKARVAFA